MCIDVRVITSDVTRIWYCLACTRMTSLFSRKPVNITKYGQGWKQLWASGKLFLYRYMAIVLLSRVGMSKDASLQVSVDIPTRKGIHLHQCNNPCVWQFFTRRHIRRHLKQRHATSMCEGIPVSVLISSKCSDSVWYRYTCSSAFIAHF